ncbi:DNA-binding protein [Xanthomonas sp. PPL139]|uniref:DNA-binding protein n=1 Tax=unclassified Xanthomonas TaxID=2643310 RepID=UPI0033B9BE16
MARGITESDVHVAADAIVALGERPTVERIRAHLGTGSPNTVVRWLDTWWQGLGSRLTQHDRMQVLTANVPDPVAVLAAQWWTLALDQARSHAKKTLSDERAALADAQDALERDRRDMEDELNDLRKQADASRQAERLAFTRATELERLVEQLQHQGNELVQQRNASTTRIAEVERAYEILQRQLQQMQEAARIERDTSTHHVRAIEDRAHAEVDRARQDAKDARQQLRALQMEAEANARKQATALEQAASVVTDLRQQLAAQQARAEALETQLGHLRDLPAAFEAAWRKREQKTKPETAAKTARVRSTAKRAD